MAWEVGGRMGSHVLLIGIDESAETSFAEWALSHRAHCVSVASSESVGSATQRFSLGVVGSLRGADAAREFRMLRKMLSGSPLVVLANALPTDAVVELVRLGAADVIGLPASPEELVARCVLHLREPDIEGQGVLASRSPSFQRMAAELHALAPLRSTVLLTGETGTGKGFLARTLHGLSKHADRPFVHVNCAALAPSVIESELFGHQRGSFTGAMQTRPGRFELARDGTVFLDEIGELEPPLQAKLLRVLDDREFERIGSTTTQVMNARVIAATNRGLRQAVQQGHFRADLFFRLEVFHLRVPALRERLEDLPLLVRSGLARIADRLQVTPPATTEAFLARLAEYSWPGNVRELMNLLERVLIRSQGRLLDVDALDNLLQEAEPDPALESAEIQAAVLGGDDDAECQEIGRVLRAVGGNISRAARRLGVPRTTLRYRVRQLGLDSILPRD
jgi:DNA-binding NtrC family response regulator